MHHMNNKKKKIFESFILQMYLLYHRLGFIIYFSVIFTLYNLLFRFKWVNTLYNVLKKT